MTSFSATISSWYVVLMGIGTVFVGLICIILICSAMGAILSRKSKKGPTPNPVKTNELISVIAGAIVASSGKDPSCIQIKSVKKLK